MRARQMMTGYGHARLLACPPILCVFELRLLGVPAVDVPDAFWRRVARGRQWIDDSILFCCYVSSRAFSSSFCLRVLFCAFDFVFSLLSSRLFVLCRRKLLIIISPHAGPPQQHAHPLQLLPRLHIPLANPPALLHLVFRLTNALIIVTNTTLGPSAPFPPSHDLPLLASPSASFTLLTSRRTFSRPHA